MPQFALLHTGIRQDEKLILQAAERLNLQAELIDLRQTSLDPNQADKWLNYDFILERCLSTVRGNAAIEFCSAIGAKIINHQSLMQICNDKFLTTVKLTQANLPCVKSILVFEEGEAKEAVLRLGGYPVVFKSREGSWGRFISKINDQDALEAALELRSHLGINHQAHLVQQYVNKQNQRDIRAAVIDGEVVAAIYRSSKHWITNTARGAQAANCPISQEMRDLCAQASRAVGGGILGMDLFETPEGLIINEINHTMEYKNVQSISGVNIAEKILEYGLNLSPESKPPVQIFDYQAFSQASLLPA